MLYKDYLKTIDWKNLRDEAIRRKKKCFVCKSKDDLVVHHLRYRNLTDVSMAKDLKVMCHRCHKLLHELKGNGTIYFKSDDHRHAMGEIRKLLKPLII